jgi:hypothetical protein
LQLEGKSHWIEFKYEKLPTFLFLLWAASAWQKGCPERPHMHRNSDKVAKHWGVWLRADSGRRKSPIAKEKGWKTPHREEQQSDGEHSAAGQPGKESFGTNGNPNGENLNDAENTEIRPDLRMISGGNKDNCARTKESLRYWQIRQQGVIS